MKYPWIDDYLRAKPGVARDFKPEWNAHHLILMGLPKSRREQIVAQAR